MEKRMNTQKNQLNKAKLEGFSKAEIITQWEILQLENEELKETIEQMRALLRLGSSQKFGASSERLKQEQAGQMSLLNDEPFGIFNEAEAIIEEEAQELEEPKKGHARRIKGEVGGSKRCFDHLPVVEVIEELPEKDKFCPSCHGQLKQMTSSCLM